MTTQSKRAPICGLLSVAASTMCWFGVYWLMKRHPVEGLPFGQLFVPYCALGGLAFAIAAWVRGEKYWALPLIGLLLALAVLGLFCFLAGSIDEKG
jgi:hypothetical protein